MEYSSTDYIKNINDSQLLEAGWSFDPSALILSRSLATVEEGHGILTWELDVHYSEIWKSPVMYFRVSCQSGATLNMRDCDALLQKIVTGADQKGLYASVSMVVFN